MTREAVRDLIVNSAASFEMSEEDRGPDNVCLADFMPERNRDAGEAALCRLADAILRTLDREGLVIVSKTALNDTEHEVISGPEEKQCSS